MPFCVHRHFETINISFSTIFNTFYAISQWTTILNQLSNLLNVWLSLFLSWYSFQNLSSQHRDFTPPYVCNGGFRGTGIVFKGFTLCEIAQAYLHFAVSEKCILAYLRSPSTPPYKSSLAVRHTVPELDLGNHLNLLVEGSGWTPL